MSAKPNVRFPRIITQFCRQRLTTAFPPREAGRLEAYLSECFVKGRRPPKAPRGWAWSEIAAQCGIDPEQLRDKKDAVEPILSALQRELERAPERKQETPISPLRRLGRRPRSINEVAASPDEASGAPAATLDRGQRSGRLPPARLPAARPQSSAIERPGAIAAKRRGRERKPRVQVPPSLWDAWDDPDSFHEALDLHMRRHGEGSYSLWASIVRPGDTLNNSTIAAWRRGMKAPRTAESLEVLARIEERYRLPTGYFKAKLPHPARATSGLPMPGISTAERRRLAWHLPDDFDSRDASEQEEILTWVRDTIISGATDYRRFQAAAVKNRYGVRFPNWPSARHGVHPVLEAAPDAEGDEDEQVADVDPDLARGAVIAPPALADEMDRLLRFKTSTLTAIGYQRNGVWGEETAAQKVEHLGLLFGALAASPRGAVHGFGARLTDLSFAHLVFPAVWDWYIQWRERRRGFYTAWELDMLRVAAALTREGTGWLRQTPGLADRLQPINGLVSAEDIARVRADWEGACGTMHRHALVRAKELDRVARVHRDPFESILPVLEADSPLAEYRKIVDEIIRLMPNEERYPISAAEAVRSILMIRLGLHTGLRQKNLRQLLVCPRGQAPLTERQLADRKRGELRWNVREAGWEIFIPALAFKNATSSFFDNNPFRLMLPNLSGLYGFIDAYLDRHRPRLLRRARDPGTLFVKTVKANSRDASYDQTSFYEAWRLIIQRFGIYNPYTGRGAIRGLLPHGPHNVRDVLATHVLKQTGSYEQASYAIQDTPDMVAKHYGRFLPRDKVSLAAQVLNKVWQSA
ncbi:hypothetical protein [Azospirillum sp.]|uniref:hypothetical protein n=1 Tax=Azospirillum sp. TaxID=34012 RepID=UPI003D70BBAD